MQKSQEIHIRSCLHFLKLILSSCLTRFALCLRWSIETQPGTRYANEQWLEVLQTLQKLCFTEMWQDLLKQISKMISHIVFQCWQQLHKLLYVSWLHSCHLISIFLLFPSEKCSLLKLEPCINPACLLLNIVEKKWEPRGVFVLITNWTPLPPPSSFGISQKITKDVFLIHLLFWA